MVQRLAELNRSYGSALATLEWGATALAAETAVAIAKGPHHGREGREVFHFPDGREKMLPVNSPVLFQLQRMRDDNEPLTRSFTSLIGSACAFANTLSSSTSAAQSAGRGTAVASSR